MQVLVTSTPGAGHVLPMVPMVLALRGAGHSVCWATGPEAGPWMGRMGLEHLAAGLDAGPRGRAALELVGGIAELPPAERRAVIGPATFGRVAAGPMADDLRGILDDDPPDLVLTEPCELAAPALATARGIPYATIGFGGLLPDEVVASMAEAVAQIWAAEGLVVPEDAGLYRHQYLHPFPPAMGAVPEGLPIAPLRPGGADLAVGDPPDWVAPLGVERQLVYVTFGTEFGAQAPFDPVLDALGHLDVDVVVTVGGTIDRATLPAVADNVRIEAFVPQRALLERAALVVSHGGSGTVLGAAASGVPQLCVPLGADQFDNAAAVAGAGLGACLLPAAVTAAGVFEECLDLLSEPPPAVGRIAGEIAAMPSAAQHVGTISALRPAGRRTGRTPR